MLAADGLSSAFVGVGHRCGQPDIAVYSIPLAVNAVMMSNNCSREEALEYVEFNVIGAWVGEETPLWLTPMDMEDYLGGLKEAGEIINEDYYSRKSACDKEEQEDGGKEAGPDRKDIQEQ